MEHTIHTASPKRYVALGLWILLAAIFFSLAKQWIVYTSSDRQLTEYVESVLRKAAVDRRPTKDIRTLVMVKAEELSIQLQPDRISVTREGETVGTVIAYDAEIRVPIVNRVLYRLEFNHNLRNSFPR
jgi:hypothetical protein